MPRVTKKPRCAATTAAGTISGTGVEVALRSEERDWVGLLPEELLSKIADLVLADDAADYIRMRAVCRSWRTFTADPSVLEPRFFPRNWLLLAGEHLRHDGEPERFVNVRTGASLRIRLPDPGQYTHHGNAEGMLLLHHTFSDRISLLNPLTMALYDLPTMHVVNDVVRPNGEYPDNEFFADSIKASGIIIDVDNLGLPTVLLSLTEGNDTAIVCAKPGDNVWRAVDLSCTDDVDGDLPVIQGGLSVRGRFYIPTCAGDVLTVELKPQPHLRCAAKMTGDQIRSGFDESSYLVPSCKDQDSGMLLVRARNPNGKFGCTKFAVNLSNGSLSLKEQSGITVFLPSVTIRSLAFPSVSQNTIYLRSQMKRLLRGDYM